MSGTTDVLAALRAAVLTQLVGCEQPLVDLHIRFVVHNFLARSQLLKESWNIAMVAGQSAYVLPVATTDGLATVLVRVFDGDRPLGASSMEGLPPASDGTPQLYALLDARTMRVYPTPPADTTTVLSVLAAITISPNMGAALTVPYVCQPHFETLMAGVLSRLYALPDKPWTSLNMAAVNRIDYARGLSQARINTMTGRAKGAQGWRYPRFGC